jgi:hypothetical protein
MSPSTDLTDKPRGRAASADAAPPADEASDLLRAAQSAVAIPLADGGSDGVLYARGLRLRGLVRRIAELPELAGRRCDRRALDAAALFHDAAWARDVFERRIPRDAVLLGPLDARQRELSADLMTEATAELLTAVSRRTAARAIREAGNRSTNATEAVILAEAVELDSIGPHWLLTEVRRCWTQGRDPAELVDLWESQVRYAYWEARIRERLRFGWSRREAQDRIAGLSAFFATLAGTMDRTP